MTDTAGNEQRAPAPARPRSWQRDMVLSFALGALSKTITAPMDRVKILLQTQMSNPLVVSGSMAPYKGMMDCMQRVTTEEGVLSLWRGNFANIVKSVPLILVPVFFNDAIFSLFPHHNNNKTWVGFFYHFLRGSIAGVLVNMVCYPLEFARLQIATGATTNILDCLVNTVRQHGATAIFAGWPMTVLGAMSYRLAQLLVFRQIQELNPWRRERGFRGAYSSFVAVTVARMATLVANYPFFTVQARMMVNSHLYTSSFHCLRDIVANEGFFALYAGFSVEILRGIGGSLVIVIADLAVNAVMPTGAGGV